MDIRQSVLSVALSVGVLLGSGAEGSQSLGRAQRDYDAAMAAAQDGRRTELLRRSYQEYATYEAAIALGVTLLGLGEWRQAREWLGEAYDLGNDDEQRARVLFRIGETHASEGNLAQAAGYLETAGGLYDEPMIREALREVRVQAQGRIVPTAEIVDTLTDYKKGARVRPRMDLHINFEFDSDRMTRDGRAQAEELGSAMRRITDDEGAAEFLLVGHTDGQGARSYNQALSVRRADTVRAYLLEEFGFDRRDIDVEGRGEDELLDRGMMEAAHSINRRVEVVRLR